MYLFFAHPLFSLYITACFEESEDLPCFHTGQDVLDKYSFNEAHLYRNLLAIVAIYFGFHILGYYCLWRRAKKI